MLKAEPAELGNFSGPASKMIALSEEIARAGALLDIYAAEPRTT